MVRVKSNGEGSQPYLVLQVHSIFEMDLGGLVLEGQPREFKSKFKGAEREGAGKVCLLNTSFCKRKREREGKRKQKGQELRGREKLRKKLVRSDREAWRDVEKGRQPCDVTSLPGD